MWIWIICVILFLAPFVYHGLIRKKSYGYMDPAFDTVLIAVGGWLLALGLLIGKLIG